MPALAKEGDEGRFEVVLAGVGNGRVQRLGRAVEDVDAVCDHEQPGRVALGLVQVADTNVLAGWVTDVLGAHAPEVGRYKNGETKLMAFFVGQVMRASKGKADPKLAQRVLEEKLAS